MADLRVIEGGNDGGARRNAEIAEQYFTDFVREMVRRLAGGSSSYAVSKALKKFSDHCIQHQVKYIGAMDEAIRGMDDQLYASAFVGNFYDNEYGILGSSLKVIAEHLADDNAAKGRLSQRREDLKRSVDTA
jgi:hypothetical protein